MLVLPDALWTAASLWAGTRAWTKMFRDVGLTGGDCVVCAVPGGAAFAQVLLACLWDDITFVPVHPRAPIAALQAMLGARAIVACADVERRDTAGVFVPDAASQPPAVAPRLIAREDARQRVPAVVFAPADAQSSEDGESYPSAALLQLVQAHAVRRALTGACVMSVQPWHTAFELLRGVLPALLSADEIVLAPADAVNEDGVLHLAAEHPVTHITLDRSHAHQFRPATLDRLDHRGIRVGE
jgi:acyl-CoA synthetase (AMP-forming)/AMP-acid ligase II